MGDEYGTSTAQWLVLIDSKVLVGNTAKTSILSLGLVTVLGAVEEVAPGSTEAALIQL